MAANRRRTPDRPVTWSWVSTQTRSTPGQVGPLEEPRLGAFDVADEEVDRLLAQQRVEAHGRNLDGGDVGVRRRRQRPHPEVAAQIEGGATLRPVGQHRVDPADLAHAVQVVQPGHVGQESRVRLHGDHPRHPRLAGEQRRDEADAGPDLEHPVAGLDDRRELARLLGLEAAGEDGPADRRGDDLGVVRDQHAVGRKRRDRGMRIGQGGHGGGLRLGGFGRDRAPRRVSIRLTRAGDERWWLATR